LKEIEFIYDSKRLPKVDNERFQDFITKFGNVKKLTVRGKVEKQNDIFDISLPDESANLIEELNIYPIVNLGNLF